MEITHNKLNRTDLMGAAASGLCAIHCTLTPLILAVRPVLEGSVGEHAHGCGSWAALDYVFLTFSLVAVWFSARYTSHASIKWILWIAWVIFAAGLFAEPLGFSHGKWLMYGGSITLVITHIQNYRYCQCDNEMCH